MEWRESEKDQRADKKRWSGGREEGRVREEERSVGS